MCLNCVGGQPNIKKIEKGAEREYHNYYIQEQLIYITHRRPREARDHNNIEQPKPTLNANKPPVSNLQQYTLLIRYKKKPLARIVSISLYDTRCGDKQLLMELNIKQDKKP